MCCCYHWFSDYDTIYIVCKCYLITTGIFIPHWKREVWRAVKPRFNLPFRLKCMYQVGTIAVPATPVGIRITAKLLGYRTLTRPIIKLNPDLV